MKLRTIGAAVAIVVLPIAMQPANAVNGEGISQTGANVGAVGQGAAIAGQVKQADVAVADYHEEVYRGEYVGNSGHSCGGKTYKTDATQLTPAGQMRVHAWIFRNCGDTTLRRKVIVNNDLDGKCFLVKPNSTRVLEVKWVLSVINRQIYERSAAC